MGTELNSATDEDAKSIKAFRAGDINAFNRLLEKYMDRIFNVCYRFLGDYEDAKDASQDVFLKVYDSLNKFRGDSSFYTWLYKITVNTCKNKLNSIEYRLFRKMGIIIKKDCQGKPNKNSLDEYIQNLPNGKPSPLTLLEYKEKELTIQRAINSLPPIQKIVVVLRDVEGFNYEEIAKITGLNTGTIKSRLFRARVRLRKKLEASL